MVTVPDDSLEPHIFTARHIGDEYNGIRREFRRAVAIAGAQHIGYYDRGLPTVAADLLAHPVLTENFRGARTVERARRDYETIGRQLNHRMTELNAALFGVGGGRLIRTVFAAPDRAVLYFDVDEGQYIVGVSLTAQALEAADLALSAAAARIRTARGLADPNYGGYHQGGYYQPPAEPLATGAVDARLRDAAGDAAGGEVGGESGGEPGGSAGGEAHVFASLPRPSVPVFASPWATLIHRRWSPLRDGREELFQAQAVNILQPADLQYIALVREGRVSAADVLDHSDLNEFFVGPGRTARRDAIEQVGAEFLVLSDLLDGLLRSVLNRRLTRTVLDVEKGALYFHRISRDEVLLGVTVDQRRVADADRRFQLLVHRFTAARGE
ncbi:hypothetical protein [Frankia sp. AvcI1]|uniref:hypothetical protein n=1 Tax=Frankia sp. AvcI1 TaxID=573496 RepID=UPI0006EC1321|nr:hypothetical protein [Frankia sp. AvcI1]